MIKVIALDIYGTVLATDDPDNELPPRNGLEAFFDKCDIKGVKVVSSSDGAIDIVKINLQESGVDIDRFNKFYRLNQLPKDFSLIVRDYNIISLELLVIGDSDKDIMGAMKYGACWIRVPEYFDKLDDFDLSRINFNLSQPNNF